MNLFNTLLKQQEITTFQIWNPLEIKTFRLLNALETNNNLLLRPPIIKLINFKDHG